MDEVKVRIANKKDIPEVTKIFREEFSKRPFNDKWKKQSALKKIKHYFADDYEIYVAMIGKDIVGFIIFSTYEWTKGIEGFIDQIVVSNKFQGRGIGRKLMKLAENYFKKMKIKEIVLYTDRRALSAKFYENIGYKQGHMIAYLKKLK